MTNMKVNPIYPRGQKFLDNQKEKLKKSKKLSVKNREHIEKFLTRCEGAGISTLRLIFYATRLRRIGEYLGKDFKKATRTDFEKVMAKLRKKSYKLSTIDSYVVVIRCFMRWIHNLDKREGLPKAISWIERCRSPNELKKEDLLTDEEVNLFIRSVNDPMAKTMIAILYEGALRPEELRSMRIKDVYVNDNTVKLYVRGKMAKQEGSRVVFLARSYPLVKDWLQNHINRASPESWLFPDKKNKDIPIMDSTFRQMIYRLSKRILPRKKIWPYLFRHSTGTWIYKTFPSPIARQMMGHAEGSRMERVYVHLSQEDLELAIENQYNLKGNKKVIKQGVCAKCGGILHFGDNCCKTCGLSENSKAAYDKDREEQVVNLTMNVLMGDPQIKKRILELREGIREKMGLED